MASPIQSASGTASPSRADAMRAARQTADAVVANLQRGVATQALIRELVRQGQPEPAAREFVETLAAQHKAWKASPAGKRALAQIHFHRMICGFVWALAGAVIIVLAPQLAQAGDSGARVIGALGALVGTVLFMISSGRRHTLLQEAAALLKQKRDAAKATADSGTPAGGGTPAIQGD